MFSDDRCLYPVYLNTPFLYIRVLLKHLFVPEKFSLIGFTSFAFAKTTTVYMIFKIPY